ncbi:DUF3237 domain-containing protein [Mucilaginibacter lappiensis]|uniref:DUF3237 domain-containing protein n=1 Tax=Mucilaginibacter lappiensis TaxID=354630 RepID=UPI003D1C6F21
MPVTKSLSAGNYQRWVIFPLNFPSFIYLIMSNQTLENLPVLLQEVKTKPLFVLRLSIAKPQIVGKGPHVNRLVGVAESGSFEGERLSGEVLPGGSDWQAIGTNGGTLMDCRLILKTTDGELIAIKYKGIRVNPPAVLSKMEKGEPIGPDEYYLRIVPVFETASEKYSWLNNIIAIGIGDRQPTGPTYSIFEVL